MQKYTKYLYFMSLFLALSSLVIIEKGGKEIYPFYSWKLFTNPSGSENFEEQYRVYKIEGKDTVRIACKSTDIYDENNIALITGYFGRKIEKNEQRESNIKKMKIFMKSYEPNAKYLILYKESYHPWDLGKSTFKIKKTFITRL